MRYFLHIAYNGYNYRGWQRQNRVLSIQEVLESNIRKLLKENVHCHGCGRTDAQVHASQYFFHMDVEKKWNFDLLFRLNKMLSEDIAVFDIIPMVGYPNAQMDATLRTYNYFIHTYKDPFLHELSSYYPLKNPDLGKMKLAVSLLLKYNNYSAFCKSPDKNPSNTCDIVSAQLFSDKKGDKLRFQISSKRFLKGMVRIIMKKLIDIGLGELCLDEFESYLSGTFKPREAVPAYPQGLYLSKITYPYLDIPPRIEFSTIFQNNVDDTWQEV